MASTGYEIAPALNTACRVGYVCCRKQKTDGGITTKALLTPLLPIQIIKSLLPQPLPRCLIPAKDLLRFFDCNIH